MSTMEDLFQNQNEVREAMEQLLRNFKKDSADRKTSPYIKKRLQTLDGYWDEFQANHMKLCEFDDRGFTYFSENHYHSTKVFYNEAKTYIQQHQVPALETKTRDRSPGIPTIRATSSQPQATNDQEQHHSINASSKTVSRGNASKLEEMLRKQKSNFKALSRTINIIDLEDISEKWEFEDVLADLKSRWTIIDSLHWEIDSEMLEDNEEYENTYYQYEQLYTKMKKSINIKMCSSSHRDNCTPKMDIPPFAGNYHKWISFQDLFSEAIHNNKSISSAQKMQFLKSKLRGEAERLVQHLTISSENYIVCWEILKNRYNNKKLIFNSHINILLSIHTMQQQSDTQIKNILDTTNECLNAIRNLGVDISTWDPLIIQLLSQKLDAQTHKEYIESLENPRDLPKLTDFLSFLENKYTSLESSKRKQNYQRAPVPPPVREQYQYQPTKRQFQNKSNNFYKNGESSKPFIKNTTFKTYATRTQNCPLCKENHGLFHCKTFLESKPEAKRNTIQRLNLCKNCLYDHKDKACYSEAKCRVCQGRHNTLLHDTYQLESTSKQLMNSNTLPSTSNDTYNNKGNVTHVSKENISEVLLATALIQIKDKHGSRHTMRALIDQGSQASLMTENAAQILGLPRKACKGVIFGVGTNQNNCKGIINITASSLHTPFSFQTDVFIMKNLINQLPNQTFQKPSWSYLDDIELADPEFFISRPVDILFGADVYSEIIMSGIIKRYDTEPVAQQTQLGWILCGNVKSYQCNVVLNNIEDIQKYWAIEDISDNNIDMSTEDYNCIQQYKSETIRREDGRYIVRLPLKPDIQNKIGESKNRAVAQFYHLEKRFLKNDHIASEYKSFINEYIELGHMRQCKNKNLPDCILPHHCVLRADSSTTKLRVVFNASSKNSKGYSLNDLMSSGPNLQQDLFTLILKWRQYQYVFTGDIEKMFRQIFCNDQDLQYQKIVWRNSPEDVLREYELTTVTYGTKAAPFLAMMTLKQLAEDERKNYPSASRVLEEDFYMDDVLSGHNSLEKAIQLKTDLTNLLKAGGFNLRKFSSNKPELLGQSNLTQEAFEFRHQESTKTLGLRWLPNEDQFKFQIKIDVSKRKTTKRSLLSDISKIFDPLGWLSPFSTKLKLLFQNVWSAKLQWDDVVPEKLELEWQKIKKSLPDIEEIKIQRWLQTKQDEILELHGFCDASTKAYACVIYCRIIKKDEQYHNYPITIVAGKTRLVPVNKTVSLPRLELSSAHLLSKLMKTVKQSLSNYKVQIYCWSDSSAVLGWIQGDLNRWKPFVANRIKQITDVIPEAKWRYVKSAENPADCASRGITAEQLINHELWWQGPTWLSSFNAKDCENQKIFITQEEVKKSIKINVSQQSDDIALKILNKYSNFNCATRILAWTLRAISRKQHKPNYLTIGEMKKARNIFIKRVQHEQFKDDIQQLQNHKQLDHKSKLFKFNPFLDQEGLLRIGGRLSNAEIHQDMKHPLIIPHTSHLTELLIDQGHQTTFHGGARLTLAWLRQQYWIIGGNRAVKKRLRNCVKCRRHSPIKQEQLMGNLPPSRSNPARPFYHTGVDFTGFVEIKANKGRGIKTCKGYIAVFVCMSTKAVHLELVSDLSSSAFLAALRRMAARRGAPGHVYSDNGTNFVGASRALNQEFINLQSTLDNTFYEAITDMKITWHFNAPSWPSAGGLWEAAVKSLKFHLVRVIGEQKLTYEEYTTLLAQLEACLNSRPLCALNEDPDDLNCLTPSHFLASGPTLTVIGTDTDMRTRWQLTQKLFEDTWKRWKSEYLCQLSARSKWRQSRSNLKINDVVIIQDINLPAGKWPIGRIIELHPGKDGYVRVVTIKTKNGNIKRPITRLSLLPVNEYQEQNEISHTSKASSNATIRIPSKFSHFLYIISILFLLIIAPAKCEHKLSIFNNNQSIYFDKIFNMRLEREEWKLIVYSDMSPYWRGTRFLKNYIDHMENICSTYKISQCDVVTLQLSHGYNELEHYNHILLGQQNERRVRRRRGLINGIGSIAHTLFGILDDDFAQQYHKDIDLIKINQNHLALLWKNQTSIVEAELNVIKRVENTMDKQHKMINQYMMKMNNGLNHIQEQVQKTEIEASFTLSVVIINNILLNLKDIQETLVDTLTNLYNENLNFHLLTLEQLKNELNVITGQLTNDITIPINNIQTEISKIYHLLKVKARINQEYLICEVRIPLVSREHYEVYKLIPIPQKLEDNMVTLVPISKYIAINMHKDSYTTMTVTDLQMCTVYNAEEHICPLRRPIYQLRTEENLCIINQKTNHCQTETTICKDMWTELNAINSYLYFCCTQCTVRIICEDNITSEQLSKAGVMTSSDGCVIKGRSFTIYTQKKHSNSMKTKIDLLNIEVPPINNIINLSIPSATIYNETENIMQQKDIERIRLAIKNMKEEESNVVAESISYHDIHHYTVIYIVVVIIVIGFIIYVWRRLRTRCVIIRSRTQSPATGPEAPGGGGSAHYAVVAERTNVEEDNPDSKRIKNRATSPVIQNHFVSR